MNLTDPFAHLIIFAALHFVADYSQSAWMAMKKCPKHYDASVDIAGPWEVLFYHCAMYTGFFVLTATLLAATGHGVFTPAAFGIIFGAHFVVDALKARDIVVKTIWLDQTLHLLTLVPLIYLGWL